jgi:tetratricopeptide (TPR) repeat protein
MTPRPAALLLTFLLGSAAAYAQEPSAPTPALERADAAWIAGDHPQALEAYLEVLAADPKNTRALARAAKLLSWRQRFGESVKWYDELLAVDPSFPNAELERARVLSWNKRFDQAAAGFRAILASDPGNRDARLGLARSLSWSGRQRTARRTYLELVTRDAADVEAITGVGQTYAWSGDLVAARSWFDRAVAVAPEDDDRIARMGLTSLSLWTGDLAGARSRLSALESGRPGDPDLVDLHKALRRARAPAVSFSADRQSDNEGTELDTYAADVAIPGSDRLRLGVGYAHYDVRSSLDEGSIDTIAGSLQWKPSASTRVGLRGGVDISKDTAGETTDDFTGSVDLSAGLGRAWQLGASAGRDTYKYSTTILDNHLVVDAFGARLSGRLASGLGLGVGAGRWQVSDDNARTDAYGTIGYKWPVPRVRVTTAYRFTWLDWEQNLANGYFDPSNFVAHRLEFSLEGNTANERFTYRLGLLGGLQSFDLGLLSVENDQTWSVDAALGLRVGGHLVVEVFGNKADYAAQNPSGFDSDQAGVRLRWQGGPAF